MAEHSHGCGASHRRSYRGIFPCWDWVFGVGPFPEPVAFEGFVEEGGAYLGMFVGYLGQGLVFDHVPHGVVGLVPIGVFFLFFDWAQ